MIGLILASAMLAGVDGYLSYRKMAQYGSGVELNPITAAVARRFKSLNSSAIAGTVAFGVQNAAVLGGVFLLGSDTLAAIYLGAKLGLAAMQIKGLQIETTIKEVLGQIKRPARP